MKRLLYFFVIIAFLLGGCSMNESNSKSNKTKNKNIPDTRAFNDPFTKKFLQSKEENPVGYYTFLSKTDGYSFALPVDSKIDGFTYTSREKKFEGFTVDIDLKDINQTNLKAYLDIRYFSYYTFDSTESSLELWQAQFNDSLNFEKTQFKNHTIYSDYYNIEDEDLYGLVGYAQNDKKAGGLFFNYYYYCTEDKNICNKQEREFNDKIEEIWLQELNFLND